MRKITVALSAIALALSAAALPAVAATEPGQDNVSVSQPAPAAKQKRQVHRKAKSATHAKYTSRCKSGEKWDAAATSTAGACVKRSAKTKVRTAKKSADQPVARTPKKKVG